MCKISMPYHLCDLSDTHDYAPPEGFTGLNVGAWRAACRAAYERISEEDRQRFIAEGITHTQVRAAQRAKDGGLHENGEPKVVPGYVDSYSCFDEF